MIDVEDLKKKHAWLDEQADVVRCHRHVTGVIRYREPDGHYGSFWLVRDIPREDRQKTFDQQASGCAWTEPVEFGRVELSAWPTKKNALTAGLTRDSDPRGVAAWFPRIDSRNRDAAGVVHLLPEGAQMPIESWERGYWMVHEVLPAAAIDEGPPVCLCNYDRGPRSCPEHGVRCANPDCDKLCDGFEAMRGSDRRGAMRDWCSLACQEATLIEPNNETESSPYQGNDLELEATHARLTQMRPQEAEARARLERALAAERPPEPKRKPSKHDPRPGIDDVGVGFSSPSWEE